VTSQPPPGYFPQDLPTPSHGTRMPVPTPPNGGRGPRAVVVIAAVAGLVAGAALVGGAWLLFGNNGGSSTPISAPEKLDDYYQFANVPRLRGKDEEPVTRQRDWDRRSSERLSASRDGAGAVVQRYSDDELENMFSLEAVRSPNPSTLYVAYTDPKVLGVDKPLEEVLTFGAVSCGVRNQTDATTVTIRCERTDADLTVAIASVNGNLLENPRDVARLVDTAWSQLT
jgi:hypothetical protein